MLDVLMYIIYFILLITVLIASIAMFVMLLFVIIQAVTGYDPDETVDTIIKYVWLKKHRSEYPGIIENSFKICYAGDGTGRRCCISFEYYSEDGKKLSHDIYFKRYKYREP